MEEKITIPTELYKRLGLHVKGFETPANVIERILDFYEVNTSIIPAIEKLKQQGVVPARSFQLEVIFHPNSESEFKKLLLQRKVAWIKLYKKDGTIETKMWKAHSFTKDSDLMGNLRSGYLRGWKDKGIYKAELAINADDLAR